MHFLFKTLIKPSRVVAFFGMLPHLQPQSVPIKIFPKRTKVYDFNISTAHSLQFLFGDNSKQSKQIRQAFFSLQSFQSLRVSTKLKMLSDLTSLTINIRAWEKYCVIKASAYKFRAKLTLYKSPKSWLLQSDTGESLTNSVIKICKFISHVIWLSVDVVVYLGDLLCPWLG